MSRLFAGAVAVVLLAGIGGPLGAQPVIEDLTGDDTAAGQSSNYVEAFNQGYEERIATLEAEGKFRLADVEVLDADARAAVGDMEESRVMDAATTLPLDPGASSKRDLVSWLVAGLDLGQLSEDGETLVLKLSPEFLDLGVGQTTGQVSLAPGEVSELVAMAIPEDVRAARVAALDDELGDFDDVEVTLTWSLENGFFGRDLSDYTELTISLFDRLDDAAAKDGTAELQRLLGELDRPGLAADDPVLMARARQAGVTVANDLVSLQGVLDRAGYFKVGDLVDNQPQLYLDVVGRFREKLVGRDEVKLALGYEKGFANVNALLDECASETGQADLTRPARYRAVTGECYDSFLKGSGVDWSKRVSLKVEYSRNPSYDLELPDDDLSLSLESAHLFRVMGSFGFDLPPAPNLGNSPPRLDFEVKYENVSDDEVRNDDRLVGMLTYSQKLTDGSTATLSLVYANEPEFLGEVKEELGARVGLKWSFDGGREDG